MTGTVVTAGETLVEFVSLETGCALSKCTRFAGPYPSGAPAIFIDQVARVGASSILLGGVGDDAFGHLIRERLERDGVDVRGIRCVRGQPTAIAFVSYFDDGTRTFIFHIENTAADALELHPEDLPAPGGDSDVYVHVSGSSLGNARIRQVVMALVERASALGWEITVDPNVRQELLVDGEARDALHALVSRASILMPSVEDLDFLLPGKGEHEAVDALLDAGARTVALKRGARGCIVAERSNRIELPGHAVDQVDPTGAGDCFCGTFVGLLASGRALGEAARLANAAGALSVTQRGPMEGNPSLSDVERYLQSVAEEAVSSGQAQ
jgi:fructokinase